MQAGFVEGIPPPDPQQQLGKLAPAMRLHQQLESSGAYEKIDPRKALLLKTYLTTETPVRELGKVLVKPLRSRARVQDLLHKGIREAFDHLEEATRQEYGSPEAAFKTRSRIQTEAKSRRLSQFNDQRRDPVTNKVVLSPSHQQHIIEANARRTQAYYEGTYTGKPLGGRRPGAGRPRQQR